jgi:hypothetical protein
VLLGASIGMLPGWARSMLRLPVLPLIDPFAVRPATSALLGGLGWALGPSPTLTAARERATAAA